MTQESHKILIKTKTNEDPRIVYSVIFRNAYYDLECYKVDWKEKKDYCYIESLTDDEGEAETFLQMISRGKAYPVHIHDLAEDYFQ